MNIIISIFLLVVLFLTGCQGWSEKELIGAHPGRIMYFLCQNEADPINNSTGTRTESMKNFRNELKRQGIINYNCYETFWNVSYDYEYEDKICKVNHSQNIDECIDKTALVKKEKTVPGKKEKQISEDENKIILLGTGTGFLINNSGYIVSNNHVTGVCREVDAIYNNEILKADLIANDTVNDLAVIKVSVPEKTKYLNISSGSKFGEDIKVYGFPLTNKLGSGLKVTKGIVSSLNGPGNNYSLIQIDAPIQPGNSGGPILNKNGNLVGVAVSSISTPLMISDTTIIPQNINFGVKSETLSNFLKANNIKFNSNDKPIEESDNLALQSTVQLNCYNTLREARKLKEQGLVRNILED